MTDTASPPPPSSAPSPSGPPEDPARLEAHLQEHARLVEAVRAETSKALVGQERMVERMLIGLLTGGHVLLEGIPGLGKTLAVRALSRALHARFQRIQFTPDLLPADIVGTVVYEPKRGEFVARQGPIFAHLVLADEINRAPAKVQSALLEAMQERRVTLGDRTHTLPQPFLVLATQNPIEQEGTYPLAEAQLDRFMLHVHVGYPSRDEERRIVDQMTEVALRPPGQSDDPVDAVQPVAHPEQLLEARAALRWMHFEPRLREYVLDVVQATRAPERFGLRDLKPLVQHGASPRASIALSLAARAHALLRGRTFVTPEDVKAVGPDILRHRIIRTFEAEAEEIGSDEIVRRVFEAVEVP